MVDTSALVKYYHLEIGSCADPRLCEAAQQEGLSVINPEEP